MAYRRRGNTFEINYYPQGRKGPRKWLTLPAEIQDEGAVQAIEAALKKARRPERVDVSGGATVAELFPLYLDWYKLHREESSFDAVEWTWRKHIKKNLGHLVAEAVNPQDLEAYTKIRKATGVSNRTVNKELSQISGFLTWAAHKDRRYITPRQFKPDMLPYKRPKPIVLSFEETMKIVAAAKPMHRAFFLCLYTLGLRMKEARLMRWEDVDLKNGIMRCIQKGGSYKILPVSRILAESLKQLRPKKAGYIFTSRTDRTKPLVDVRKAIGRACSIAKVTKHVNPHLFRHSIATYGLGKQVNLRVIQGFLGHGQVGTTEWYTHVNTEHLEKMRDLIDQDAAAVQLPAATTEKARKNKGLKKLPLQGNTRKASESRTDS